MPKVTFSKKSGVREHLRKSTKRLRKDSIEIEFFEYKDGSKFYRLSGYPYGEEGMDYEPFGYIIFTSPFDYDDDYEFVKFMCDYINELYKTVNLDVDKAIRKIIKSDFPCIDCYWKVSFGYLPTMSDEWRCTQGHDPMDVISFHGVCPDHKFVGFDTDRGTYDCYQDGLAL